MVFLGGLEGRANLGRHGVHSACSKLRRTLIFGRYYLQNSKEIERKVIHQHYRSLADESTAFVGAKDEALKLSIGSFQIVVDNNHLIWARCGHGVLHLDLGLR